MGLFFQGSLAWSVFSGSLCALCLRRLQSASSPLCVRPARVPGRSPVRAPGRGGKAWVRGAGAFIPIQVAGIQYRIYGALTLSRQEGTARLMGWAGWGNNRLFDVTSLIGVDLLTD